MDCRDVKFGKSGVKQTEVVGGTTLRSRGCNRGIPDRELAGAIKTGLQSAKILRNLGAVRLSGSKQPGEKDRAQERWLSGLKHRIANSA